MISRQEEFKEYRQDMMKILGTMQIILRNIIRQEEQRDPLWKRWTKVETDSLERVMMRMFLVKDRLGSPNDFAIGEELLELLKKHDLYDL